MKSVSVIIPAYNAEVFIARTLKNLALQTLAPTEIIVVDDESDDQTVEIARQLGATVIEAKHGGPGAARNLGIAAAKGDWIAFIDADDFWHPEKLERDMLAAECADGIDVVVSDMDKIDEQGTVIAASMSLRLTHCEALKRTIASEVSIFDREALERALAEWSFFLPSAFVIRKKAINDVGPLAADMRYGTEDVELFLRCAAKCTIAFVEASMVGYVQHSAQITQNNPRLRSQREVTRYVLDRPSRYSPAVLRTIRAQWPTILLNSAKAELRSGHFSIALQMLLTCTLHVWNAAFLKRYAFRLLARVAFVRRWLLKEPTLNLIIRRIPASLPAISYSRTDWKGIIAESV